MSDKSVATMIEKTSDQITPMLHVFLTHTVHLYSIDLLFIYLMVYWEPVVFLLIPDRFF